MALIAFRKLRWKRVRIYKTDVSIGRIKNILFDPDNLICKACELVKSPFSKMIVSSDELIFTSHEPSIKLTKGKPKEVDRVDMITVLSTPVYTQTGTFLGKVDDFIFDTTNLTLLQIDVERHFFFFKLQSFLIHRSEIIKVELHKIIVKDEILRDETDEPRLLSSGIDWSVIQNKTLQQSKTEKI